MQYDMTAPKCGTYNGNYVTKDDVLINGNRYKPEVLLMVVFPGACIYLEKK